MNDYLNRLNAVAEQKLADYSAKPELRALALTGSIARGLTWRGSDVDMWGFTTEDGESFADGMIDDIYWEIDIKPLTWLDVPLDIVHFLTPPSLNDTDGVGLLEALWGCRVVKDEDGRLTQAAQFVKDFMANPHYLRQRAVYFLAYGRGYLEGLADHAPMMAIVLAREVALRYGIGAYWMQRGQLLSSMVRVPERLADSPEIQRLFMTIYGLEGKAGAEDFLAQFKTLPASIQAQYKSDMTYDILPALELGLYDGAIRHMRQIMPDDCNLDEIAPVMAFESDLAAQKNRVIQQCFDLLDLVTKS